MNKKNPQAFSIIELSIVILVISLLIFSVLAGKQLISNFNLTKAQSLTNSSSVGGIEDLAFWFETTLEKSFLTDEIVDGGTISQWNDINPRLELKKNMIDLTAGTSTDRPIYTEDAINGLPALYFDGAGDFLGRDNVTPNDFTNVGGDTTVFIVSKPITPVQEQATIYWHGSGMNYFNVLAPWSDSNIYWDMGVCCTASGRSSAVLPANFIDKWNIASYIRKKNGTGEIMINNTLQTPINSSFNSSLAFQDSATLYIGAYNGFGSLSYRGYMAEIIIYSRELSEEERYQVTNYLSRKWGIKIK